MQDRYEAARELLVSKGKTLIDLKGASEQQLNHVAEGNGKTIMDAINIKELLQHLNELNGLYSWAGQQVGTPSPDMMPSVEFSSLVELVRDVYEHGDKGEFAPNDLAEGIIKLSAELEKKSFSGVKYQGEKNILEIDSHTTSKDKNQKAPIINKDSNVDQNDTVYQIGSGNNLLTQPEDVLSDSDSKKIQKQENKKLEDEIKKHHRLSGYFFIIAVSARLCLAIYQKYSSVLIKRAAQKNINFKPFYVKHPKAIYGLGVATTGIFALAAVKQGLEAGKKEKELNKRQMSLPNFNFNSIF